MAEADLAEHSRAIRARGFTVLPRLFRSSALNALRAILDQVVERAGSPGLDGFGYAIHPLIERAPDIAPFFAEQLLVEVAGAILGAPVRLAHTGARIASEESSAAIGWHHHYGWPDHEVLARRVPARLLLNIYVDGSDDDIGPLIVLPRRIDEPLDPPSADLLSDWPGQVVVRCPPGAAVFFDTALWHTAKRGLRAGRRRHWGAHLQRAGDARVHREDNGSSLLRETPLTADPRWWRPPPSP